MNIIEAVRDALRTQMRADRRVVVLGEDVGKFGGVFRATSGLYDEFGADRVIDTPLAEAGIIGTAIGMALYGLRPVPEIQFGDFIFPAFDQIVNELAKFRYRSGGNYTCPVVIRTPVGGGIRGGHYHSQSPRRCYIHNARPQDRRAVETYDAKGLLLASCARKIRFSSWSPSGSIARRGDVPRRRLHHRARPRPHRPAGNQVRCSRGADGLPRSTRRRKPPSRISVEVVVSAR